MHVYPATHVFICVIVHHTVLHYSVEACSANVLLTASNPQGFLKEAGQKPQCSGTCSSVVKHYWINLHLQWDVLGHCLKAFDLILTSTAPNLIRHKSSPGGAEEAKPPPGEGKAEEWEETEEEKEEGGCHCLYKALLSSWYQSAALCSHHKILSGWYDSWPEKLGKKETDVLISCKEGILLNELSVAQVIKTEKTGCKATECWSFLAQTPRLCQQCSQMMNKWCDNFLNSGQYATDSFP